MKTKKYIVVDMDGLEYPVLFSELVQHVDEAGGRKVVGAGFFNPILEENRLSIETYGESVSLKVKSRGSLDAEIIRKFLFD